MELRGRETSVGGVPVLELDGEVDLATLPHLHQVVQRFVDAHAGAVVAVDLDQISALADAGFGVLLGAAARARSRHGELVLVCAGTRLRARLTETRLDRAVTVVATAAAAATT